MTCECALKLAVLKNRRKAVALEIEERAAALWRLESGACVVGGEWQSSSLGFLGRRSVGFGRFCDHILSLDVIII